MEYTVGSVPSLDLEVEPGTLSYIRGSSVPLLEQTIHEVFAETARKFPDRPAVAVCHQGVHLTWAEFAREVERTARGLAGLGLEPGDRIGIWASNCLEWVLLQVASARAGFVLVNVNPAYRSHELRFVLKKSRIRALFLHERDARADYREILAESRNGDALPLEHVVWIGTGLLARHDRTRRGRARPPRRPGRRGQHPVHLRHHRLAQRRAAHAPQPGEQRARDGPGDEDLGEQDRICAPVPLYHCFGSVIGAMVCYVTRRRTGAALGAVRRAGHAPGHPRGARHGGLRRPHHVHRRTRAPRVRALRLQRHAHRRDGRRAVPHRGDEAGGGADALPRDHHRLRADGEFARHHHVPRRRSARAARGHGGRGAAQHGGEDRLHQDRRDAAHRRAGRTMRARLPGDEGL